MKKLKFNLIKITFLFFTLISCNKKVNSQNAVSYYEKQLSLIEDNYNGNSKGEIETAVNILEKVTKIKSFIDYSYAQKPLKIPLKHNIEDWKKWLVLNKKFLSFNEELEELEIKKGEKSFLPLVKNPSEVFINYVDDLKKMSVENKFHINEIDYRLSVLEKITKYKDIDFHKGCNCFFPKEKDFKEFDKWLKLNKEKLIWNEKEQIIEVSSIN